VAWLESLLLSVETGAEFKKSLDPTLCAFGKWYEALALNSEARQKITLGSPVLENLLAAFDAPHRRIHGIAERVLSLAKSGRQSEAQSIIAESWETDLSDMKQLFRQLIEAFAEQRRPCVLVIDQGEHPFGLVVDEVSAVRYCENDAFEVAPEASSLHAAFSERLVRWNEDITLVISPQRLVEAIAPQMAA
jgi:hypothetical protein